MLNNPRHNRRLSLWTAVLVALLVSYGTASAGIGFRRITPLDQLVDPVRFPPRIGLSSTIWDTSAVDTARIDSTALDSAAADSALQDSLLKAYIQTQKPDSSTLDSAASKLFVSDSVESKTVIVSAFPAAVDTLGDSTALKLPVVPDSAAISAEELAAHPESLTDSTGGKLSSAAGTAPLDAGAGSKEAAADTTAPPPWHPTNVGSLALPLEIKSAFDSTSGYITFSTSLNGTDLALSGAMPSDLYVMRQTALADRTNRRQSVISKLPTTEKKSGGALVIEIPVIKSKRAQRIFGGPNIGLTVSGAIQIDGSLTTEKKNETRADNKNPTNYAFKINQKQQFNIKGKVGEKVSVEIDQDSEKLFEFENSLRVRYKGDEDEIVQSVEAGNVSLSLGGMRLATASSNHKGLFGFKTESKLGALKLTTIASLDKGEKNSKRISGGAQRSEGVKIKPREYVQGRYYFLDYNYRDNYKIFNANMNHVRTRDAPLITRLEVYKSVRVGENENSVQGWAFYDTREAYDPERQDDKQHQRGNFLRLVPGTDYIYDLEFGWIRLVRPLDNESILAAAWQSEAGVFGDLDPLDNNAENPFILKLIQPKGPQPTDSTWQLMWRNVYDLRATGINEESFVAKITKTTDGGSEGKDVGNDKSGTQHPYIYIFDLDLFNVGIPGQDGKVDPMFVDLGLGEIRFPDLQPFNPEGWKVIDEEGNIIDIEVKLSDADRDTALYTTAPGYGGLDRLTSQFTIVVQYSDASASYNLGFGVLEGSEEVILNGRKLSRGTDYSIDYITGSLTIINKDATTAGADLEIKYETGQIFQLDTQTMLGIRAEYELWERSTIGAAVLHLSQKTVEQRVRVGGEPKENTVWDLNTQLNFQPEFLTRAVDWLPLIETDAPSNFSISAEIAQVFPNPNSLSSPSTGDPNGVAYVDDFESVKRSTPLGITRRQWTPSSFPAADARGSGLWERQRGRLWWYNPDQVDVSVIWPDRQTQAGSNSTIQVLQIDFQPWWTAAWGDPPPAGIDPKKSWGGVMRYLGPGYADQSQSKYIEVWLKEFGSPQGTMYFDLGRISEDIIADGKSNTEDHPREGFTSGDGVVTKEEDTGIDGVAAPDPLDLTYVNGIESPKLPSYDDWSPRTTGGDWRTLNGTEGNGSKSLSDEGGHIPDTEDLSGDGFPDGANDFFRYRLDLSEGTLNKYIVGGQGNNSGWRLYRIPLITTLSVGKPNFTQFEYVRIWFTGFTTRSSIQIASMEIVGNEWREVKVDDGRDSLRDPVSIAVINTHDNPEYGNDSPPGVAGEIDPITGLREKEQSLVIRINKLGTGEIGSAQKVLTQKIDLLEYRELKMFVHGGAAGSRLVDHFGRPLDLEMFLRFGSELPRPRAQAHYYEYSQRLSPGWAPANEIVIDLERLGSLKFLRESDSTRDYDILPDGDVIRVVGTPSLRNIGFLEIGLKNHGQEITAQDAVEIWVDEMRVSDIYRNSGWAASGETRVSFADLLDVSADITQRQADFHNLNERSKRDPSDELAGNFNTELQVGQVFDKRLGINIPLAFRFRQGVSIPKYKPNSDVKLTSISGENPGLWRRFMGDITSAKLFRTPPSEEGAIDSLVSTDKTYTITGGFSKTGKSDNLLTNLTIDRFKVNGSFQEIWGRDYNSLLEYKRVSTGNVSYVISMDKPPELQWMSWAADLPVLNKISESTFRPMPTAVNLSASGNESFSRTLRRSGVKTGDTTFTIDRSYSTGWRPFQILNFDFSQTIGSSRIVEDTMRTMAAYRMSNLDSTVFWHITDTSRRFDTLGWRQTRAKDVQRIKDGLFWKGFGYYFVDDELSQRASAGFSPVFLSWLGTETNYSTTYSWRWGRNLLPSERSTRANANFTGTITLRLPQLTAAWKADRAAGAEGSGPANMKAFPGDRGKGSADSPPDDIRKQRIPDLGPDGLPIESFDKFDPLDLEKLPGINDTTSLAPDSLALDSLGADTLLEKKPVVTMADVLKFGKRFVAKIRDVQYSYTQTGDVSNSGIAEGQADWAYRLGFTRDPGLDTVKGYFRESYNLSVRNRINTGYDITQNLTVNSIEMTFAENRNYGQIIQGSSQRPVFLYFGDDKVSIKKFPAANWSVRWGGWESLPYVKNWANTISLDHAFNGSQTEVWRQAHRDSSREIANIDYEKGFQPLLGITFAWKGGVGTNVRYVWNQTVQDMRTGNSSKNRNTTSSVSVSGSYTSRKGFRIPIPVWPFKNRKFENSTTFSLSFSRNATLRESRTGSAGFTVGPGGESESWSVTPSVDYTFSSAVRGGFRYTYSAQKANKTSSKSQEFGFTVNISIRG